MRLLNILIGFLVVLFLVLGAVTVYFLISMAGEEAEEESPSLFSVLETGTASHYGYAVFNYRGEGNVTVLSHYKKPNRGVVIINDSDAIQATRLPELIEDVRALEDFGYEISVVEEPKIGNAIYIVPTGAIPSYALFSLQQGTSNGTIIYIGEKDLLLSKGIRSQEWFESLLPEQQGRIVHYNGTLDEFIEGGGTLADTILYETWNQEGNTTMKLSGAGLKTAVIELQDSEHLSLVYQLDSLYGVFDSYPLTTTNHTIDPSPRSIYPWQRSTLRFLLNKTNGTASLLVKKDGKVIEQEILRRVTDENVFIKRLQYDEPGEYVIEVEDNSGTIASGLLHVNELEFELIDSFGVTYVFSVTVDGEPLEDTEILVSLGNSTDKKKFYVSDGTLAVNAKLERGENVFHMETLGSNVPVIIYNDRVPLLEFYLTYGTSSLVLVLLVYFGARMTKKPMYRVRFGDAGTYIRQEIRIPPERAIESFKKVREDMNLGKNPVTPHEFSVSLKRYLTNGADVTEGNVEEILKNLVTAGLLEAHRDYYQLKGDGDVEENALRRMIREDLIESGVMFKEKGKKFITKDYEIGFFGSKFSKKGIIIVDSEAETRRILAGLSKEERARITIMQSNGTITFVPIDDLKDVL